MARRADPFGALPFAIAGLVVGLGLVGLCGTIVLDRWGEAPRAPDDGHAVIDGTVQRAQWRQSARTATRFLQVHLEGDPRGFLVAATDLTEGFPSSLRAGQAEDASSADALSRLEGQRAVIVVEARFQEAPRPARPHMKGLRIGGEPVVRGQGPATDAPPSWPDGIASVLVGTGLLVGLGLFGASGHHLLVCLRHGRRDP